MKRTLLCTLCSLMLSMLGVTAWGQQINGDFSEWEDCVPWQSDDNTVIVGTQPRGWKVSNVTGAGIFPQTVAAKNGGTGEHENAVKLTNKSALGNGIPAYLTLGTPWATSIGTLKVTDTDGGTWGGISFAYKPDSITFDYKKDDVASVVAYLWDGTWIQENVPGVCVTKGTPKSVSMENRDRNILNLATSKGGDVIQKGFLVASLNVTMPSDENVDGKWNRASLAFDYADADAKVSMLNVVFAANDYFGDRSNIKKDKYLTVDNVRLVYCHSLSSCTYDNQKVVFDTDNNAKVDALYDESKLVYEKKGVGATVEKSYDDTTGKLTITVKGNDYEANTDSKTVYMIQFADPTEVVSSKEYVENLYVSVEGYYATPSSIPVTVETRRDGKINFLLNNFTLELVAGDDPMYIGNIKVDALAVKDGKFSCQDKTVDITAGNLDGVSEDQWMGPYLSILGVKANMDGSFVGDNNIKTYLTIAFEDMNINVHLGYTPTIATMAVKEGCQYGTFYAPFDVTLPSGVKAYTCEEMEANGYTLKLTSVDGTIAAKTAIIVEASEAVSQNFYNFDADLKLENGSTGYLYGVAEGGKTSAPLGSYVLQKQESGEAFYKVTEQTGDLRLGANRCYLQFPADKAGVKAISFPGDATAIDAINALVSGKAEIYDLQGRRLPALQKGINVVNGRKVMVK